MKVSINWLKEFVDYNLSPAELADKLSLTSVGVKEQTEDFLELDLTYNRGDLLSLRGVVREIAAVTDSKPLFSSSESSDGLLQKDLPKIRVEVQDEKLCPVYCVAKIEGLEVKPSSGEWVKRLNDCGVRSVNSVADVTNLIMLEYGQPMHAFDASKVKDETIVVRVANPSEKVVTLDGKNRDLEGTDLLIADSEKALGLAGVMGGKDSEVTETTETILLEAAIFDPVANRNTSKRHGIYSEATKRFQHGLTKTNLLQALAAAIKMYESLGGKLTAITLTGNLQDENKTVHLTQQKVNSLMGVNISSKQIESTLLKLGFKVDPSRSVPKGYTLSAWEVTVPYWRLDINIEEDLIEEVARMYGYEKIEGTSLPGEKAIELDQSFYEFIYNLKVALKGTGLTEVETYSFYCSQVIENLQLNPENLLRIANPISTETEYMRDNLWPNLLEVTAKNIRNGIKDIAIFELGKVYAPRKGDLPNEVYHLAIILYNGTPNPIQELYQIFQNLSSKIPGVKISENKEGSNEYFHPTRYAAIEKNGQKIGEIAEIHPRFVNKFGVEQKIAVLEIEINPS